MTKCDAFKLAESFSKKRGCRGTWPRKKKDEKEKCKSGFSFPWIIVSFSLRRKLTTVPVPRMMLKLSQFLRFRGLREEGVTLNDALGELRPMMETIVPPGGSRNLSEVRKKQPTINALFLALFFFSPAIDRSTTPR